MTDPFAVRRLTKTATIAAAALQRSQDRLEQMRDFLIEAQCAVDESRALLAVQPKALRRALEHVNELAQNSDRP